MNQRQYIEAVLVAAYQGLMHWERLIADLDHAVGVAQNRAPLGAGDGSLTSEQWTLARDAARALRDVETALLRAGRVFPALHDEVVKARNAR